jgi:hypothetical protein
MQITMSDTKAVANNLEKQIMMAGQDLRNSPPKDKDEYTRLVEERKTAIEQWFQLQMDLARIQKWMITNKVPDKNYFDKLQNLQNKDLPMPGGEEVNTQIQRAIELRKQVNESR